MTRHSVQDVLDWCRHEMDHPSRNWDHDCMMMTRSALGQAPWAYSARLAYQRIPDRFRYYTPLSKVPAGVPCFGLLNTNWGHAWISARGDAGFTVDYRQRGRIDRAPVNLPAWTNDSKVRWTDWSPFGMLDFVWEDPRNKGLHPAGHK